MATKVGGSCSSCRAKLALRGEQPQRRRHQIAEVFGYLVGAQFDCPSDPPVINVAAGSHVPVTVVCQVR